MGNACTSESGAAQQADPLLAALAQKDVEAKAMLEEMERLQAVVERSASAAASGVAVASVYGREATPEPADGNPTEPRVGAELGRLEGAVQREHVTLRCKGLPLESASKEGKGREQGACKRS